MTFREATINDIRELHLVRTSVKENILRNPLLICENDYIKFLTISGKGWLCESNNTIVGFAIIDIEKNNIWALFVLPGFEKKGIGKKLQIIMLDWFFTNSDKTLWLSTAANTRAENFYVLTGWTRVCLLENAEVKFEMTHKNYKNKYYVNLIKSPADHGSKKSTMGYINEVIMHATEDPRKLSYEDPS